MIVIAIAVFTALSFPAICVKARLVHRTEIVWFVVNFETQPYNDYVALTIDLRRIVLTLCFSIAADLIFLIVRSVVAGLLLDRKWRKRDYPILQNMYRE